jgi:1-deoxy-D-xylulose-5-phosphate reductoisomerase
MKRRIAVLGATGSIGRQALEVIEANSELELVAATSGSTPIDGLAPLTQVGGDATDVLEQAEPDVVLNAIVGFAGIHATLWALERGVTLAHPTWTMGPKITVDSATLANKGLELLEAHFLFDLPYDRIEVAIHPTSIVHAIVRLRDGASLAHLGYPDMHVPISFALTYPARADTPLEQLDFSSGLRLEFHAPDLEAFPLLALAREAGERGGTYPCTFNAANEVAVQAFLEGRIRFLDIDAAVADVLDRVDGAPARDVDELIEADRKARNLVAVA